MGWWGGVVGPGVAVALGQWPALGGNANGRTKLRPTAYYRSMEGEPGQVQCRSTGAQEGRDPVQLTSTTAATSSCAVLLGPAAALRRAIETPLRLYSNVATLLH